jgi:hypothetical protein
LIADFERSVADQHGGHRTAAFIEFGFEDGTNGRASRIGFEIEHVGDEQNHFEQKIEILFGFGGDGDHDDIAAPIFGQHSAIGELLLNAIGLGSRFVDFVDSDNHRDAGRSGVIDGFEGLGHDAIVGGDDEHNDIGDLGSAGAHAGERLVAGRIDEDDLAAVFLNVISADVLGNTAGFAASHIGFADGIEQRGFTVIDVTHDGDDRGAANEIRGLFGFDHFLGAFLLVSDLVGGSAEITRQIFGEFHVESLVNGGEDLLFEQLLDDKIGFDAELF